MKLKSFTLITSIFLTQLIYGQQIKISGKVIDKTNASPIGFANISLLNTDSVFIKGANSDASGHFAIKDIPTNQYLLSVSYLGYDTFYKSIDNSGSDHNLQEIGLEPAAFALNEAVVSAQSVINKSDRKLITPSRAQIEASTSGLDLLQKLQLPRINIDYINSKITASNNGTVQLRINGIEVTNAEIVSLRPEDIIRIEFHDDPSIRYGNAAAVLDYITRRKESGGNVNGNAMHGLKNIGFVEDFLSTKLNHKKSEFAVNSFWRYRKIDWTRTNDETFRFSDKELHRLEQGLPSSFKENQVNTAANYSLMEKDNYFLNATFRYNFWDMPNSYSDRKSILQTSYNPIPLTISDHSEERYKTPALDLYFQKNLKNEQLLIFNIVGTYISSTSKRHYTEYREDTPIIDITSDINGNKYSIIAEGIYERKLGIGKLTSGMKHRQIYSNNTYSGDITKETLMKQAESSLYTEYMFKKGKVNYMVGISGTRFYYSQEDRNQTKYIFQPSVRITYNPNDNTYLRYRLNLWSHTPSLVELNDVIQQIDSLQIRRGNPDLKANYSVNNNFAAGYNKGIFGIDFNAQYTYRNKPVMETTLYKDGMFIRTSENQKMHHHINMEASFKIKPWKEYITINIAPGFNRYISKGNDYTHNYNNEYIRGNIDAMYKGWIFTCMAQTSQDWFYGETLREGETLYMMGVGYAKPKWSIMLGAFNPFGGSYKRYEENWSKLAPSKNNVFTNDLKQMVLLRASFNINFGRQFNAGNKRMNNSDNDSGIMSGAKK